MRRPLPVIEHALSQLHGVEIASRLPLGMAGTLAGHLGHAQRLYVEETIDSAVGRMTAQAVLCFARSLPPIPEARHVDRR